MGVSWPFPECAALEQYISSWLLLIFVQKNNEIHTSGWAPSCCLLRFSLQNVHSFFAFCHASSIWLDQCVTTCQISSTVTKGHMSPNGVMNWAELVECALRSYSQKSIRITHCSRSCYRESSLFMSIEFYPNQEYSVINMKYVNEL